MHEKFQFGGEGVERARARVCVVGVEVIKSEVGLKLIKFEVSKIF